ncbi:class II holin family protein [Escherichia coli]|uniref:class II holin family protein n=4 Tax=Escherichia coli TaxID=562 RepID=UPI0029C4F157|nr:class II holin family protein [Escherichia coli]MDX5557860.1 class II holin family protein [Escherichia coli]
MYQMEKITTGVSYTTSAVGTGYWLLQLLDKVSPSQWVAIGVLGSLVFGLLTYLTIIMMVGIMFLLVMIIVWFCLLLSMQVVKGLSFINQHKIRIFRLIL